MNFLSPSVLETSDNLKQAFFSENKKNEEKFCSTTFALGVAIHARTTWAINRMRQLNLGKSAEEIYATAFYVTVRGLCAEVIGLGDTRLSKAPDLIENDGFRSARKPPDNNHANDLGAYACEYWSGWFSSVLAPTFWKDVITLLAVLDGFRGGSSGCGSPCNIRTSPWWGIPDPSCDATVWTACISASGSSDLLYCVGGAGGILAKQVCMAGSKHEDTIVVRLGSTEAHLHTELRAKKFLDPYPNLVPVGPRGAG